MKRNYIPFIAGMSTMLLLVGLVGASLAGETRPPAVPQSGTLNGQVAYGEAGVALFGKEQVPAGAAWTTEDGAQIPTVLTYTDENGEDHYFISAETAAEVLDPAAYLGRFVDGVALQGADLTYTFHFMPELPYAALVIENQGDQDILVRVFRPWTVGHINQELFSMVRIPAGETLVRAFQVQEGESADLRNKLTVEITGIGDGEAQVRLSSEQYGGSTRK